AEVGVFVTGGQASFNSITISQVPEFALSGPTFFSQNSLNGIGATYDFQISPLLNFGGTVTMSVSGLPPNVTGTFSPPTITGGGSTILTLTADSGAASGSNLVTVTATSGATSQTSMVRLWVSSGVNMTIAAPPVITGSTAAGVYVAQIPITVTG